MTQRSPCWSLRRLTMVIVALATLAGAAGAETPAERGRYLVESILGCGNCHTPREASGEPVAERNLAGGGLTFSIPPFSGAASNITPDRDTGIGTWTDAEIKRAIVEGMRPNHGRLANMPLAPIMPVPFFKGLLPNDLDAVVAYLRSVKPVRNEVAAPVYRMPARHERYPPAEGGFTEAMMADPVKRGAYLVTIGHCMECHSPMDKGVSDYARLGAGGREFNATLVQGFPSNWPGHGLPTSHRIQPQASVAGVTMGSSGRSRRESRATAASFSRRWAFAITPAGPRPT